MSGTDDSPLRRRAFVALAGTALALTAEGARAQAAAAPPVPVRRASPSRAPRLALVLGAGLARGFAHIGVIKALEKAGIKPDAIFGCSAGALVGAFWAAGFSGSKMEVLAQNVRDEEVLDLVSGGTNSHYGLVTGQALQNFVSRALGDRTVDSLPTPFYAVATAYPSGELQVFDRGDVGFAVRASCSIPGVFMPATRDAQAYLDGGLVSPLPVRTARAMGYEVVVAVDVGGNDAPANDATGSLYQLLLRSFEIMGDSLRRHEASEADIVIRPSVTRIAATDFAARSHLLDAGFVAGQRLAPVIIERLKRRA